MCDDLGVEIVGSRCRHSGQEGQLMTVLLEPASGTQFVEGALQMVGIDGASVVEGSGREGVMRDPVDLAWEAAGRDGGWR